MTLTRQHRNNLRKLAIYLEALPEDYRHFDMDHYMRGASESVELEYALKNGGVANCGAVACAVGHGPAAGVLFQKGDLYRSMSGGVWPDWDKYAARYVGAPYGFLYDWAFGGMWHSHDNHHWGAAARIRYLLKHGSPPTGFDYPAEKWREVCREFDKRHAQPMSAQ